MSWQHRERRDASSTDNHTYGRRAYELPAAQRPPVPAFVDPLESVQRPRGYPERDNGWGNRHGNRERVQSYHRPQSDHTWTSERTRTVDPRHNARPPTTDPRIHTASPSYVWEAETSAAPSPPAVAMVVSEKERKLEYLLRTIERRLEKELRRFDARWERLDTHLFSQLIEEHKKVNQGGKGTMMLRTMSTALNHYRILVHCTQTDRADATATQQFDAMRHGLQFIVFDICEDENAHIRKQGYRALLTLSRKDMTLVKSNLSALVQMLANKDDDLEERHLVREILVEHLMLAKAENHPGASLVECVQLMFCEQPKSSDLVVDFFSTEWGEKVIDLFVGNPSLEAALAQGFATILPQTDRSRVLKIVEVLHTLQSIWPGPEDQLSEANFLATRNAAAAVLWSLGRFLIAQANVYDFPAAEDGDGSLMQSLLSSDINKALQQESGQTHPGPLIPNGLKTFSHLVTVVDDRNAMVDRTYQRHFSQAKIFVEQLEKSTAFLFCFLPLDADQPEAPLVIDHLTAAQRIVLFRSSANLAARVASAVKQSPPGLGFPGHKTASEIAQVISRALMTQLSANINMFKAISKSSPSNQDTQARHTYIILAAEPLLIALDQCESCMADAQAGQGTILTTWNVRGKMQALLTLVDDFERNPRGPAEVQAAAKTVIRLGKKLNGEGRMLDAEQTPPTWFKVPENLPGWTEPSDAPQVETNAPATPTSPRARSRRNRSGSKRRASTDDTVKEERRVRGRGQVHAFTQDDPDQSWESIGHNKPAAAASTSQQVETGISIRGASKAEPHSPTLRGADCYRPPPSEPRASRAVSPLLERIGARSESERRTEPLRSRDRDRPRHVSADDRSRGWYDDDASRSGYRHGADHLDYLRH